jgi:hypothetical protein
MRASFLYGETLHQDDSMLRHLNCRGDGRTSFYETPLIEGRISHEGLKQTDRVG